MHSSRGCNLPQQRIVRESTSWVQVRAKYMTLAPGANRYIKHLRPIRIIQDYLVRCAMPFVLHGCTCSHCGCSLGGDDATSVWRQGAELQYTLRLGCNAGALIGT